MCQRHQDTQQVARMQPSGIRELSKQHETLERKMTNCCSTSTNNKTPSRKQRCPVDGEAYAQVSIRTILHHLKTPWSWHAKQQNYYFCDAPDCEVVYFGEDDSVIYKSDLRTLVGIKEDSADAPLCYCFDVSKADARQDPTVKEFVVQQTKAKQCACEILNPSGRCCLKDFPAASE